MLFYACAVQKPNLSLGCVAQQGFWSDLRADIGALFFPPHTVAQGREFVLCVSDEVANGLQMSIGLQILEDVEEPMPARPATH